MNLIRPIRTALLAAFAHTAAAAPYISEILAKNDAGLLDADGTRQDWIELHNPDAAAADLSGYVLTDDPEQPERWVFPDGVSIPGGGYLVVFASGKDRRVAGQPLHTSFSLSSGGEYLALSAPGDGDPVSQFAPFPPQSADVSWGRLSADAAAGFGYFNPPTPGASNNPATSAAEAVQFSAGSRTFTGSFQVVLSVQSPTAAIRYSTNRSEPTATSPLYAGTPITISSSTRLRARAFEPARPAGPVSSETYLRLDGAAAAFTSTLPIVVTTTWGASVPATNTQVAAHLMVFEPKSGTARLTNAPDISTPCVLERRGSSTAGAAKYSLKMETQDESGDDRAISVPGMPRDADWVLHAPYDYDRTLMHNDLIYRISNDAGRYAPRTRFVEHFHDTTTDAGTISGALSGSVDYFGVYSFMEKITRGADRVDVENLTTADNTAPRVQGGYIFKVDRIDPGESALSPLPGQSFGGIGSIGLVYPKQISADPSQVITTAQNDYLRGAIGRLSAALGAANFMDPALGYAAHMDVGAAVDHHLLNVAAKNVDALRLSAYWHKPRYGLLAPGPLWDFDRAMGSTDGRDLIPTTWRGDNGDLGTDFFHYPWYNEMFRDPNFWQAWIDRLHELRSGVMSTANVHALIDAFAAQLNPGNAANTPAKRNITRWNGPRGASASTPGTDGTFGGEVQWLKNWWAARLAFMDGQFTRPVTASVPSGPVAAGTQVALASPSLSRPGALIYYTTSGADPRPRATGPDTGQPVIETKATLIPEISTVRAIVPVNAAAGGATGIEWRDPGFDDSAWFTNAPGSINGVGYDDTQALDFAPWIGLRWNSSTIASEPQTPEHTMRASAVAPLFAGNQSCFIRYTFAATAEQIALIGGATKLTLSIRCDDGFTAWINGQPSANLNPPATWPAIAWDSAASSVTADAAASIYREFDLSAAAGALRAGQNVLAIQGLNAGLASPDQLCQAKLTIVGPIGGNPITGQPYGGPITVNAPLVITARTYDPATPSDPPALSSSGPGTVPNGSRWSAPQRLYYFPGAVPASAASLRISEVLYHPPPATAAEIAAGHDKSNDFEFIRLTNTGTAPLDLTGIRLSSAVEFTSAPGLQNWLPAGQSVVVVENAAAFSARYGSTFAVLGEFRGELDDAGDTLSVHDRTGAVIASFTWDDEAPWPAAADAGHSLIFRGGDPALPANWTASPDPGGTGVTTPARWLHRWFPGSTGISLTDDTDGDGFSNLYEFAFLTNPAVPDATTPLSIVTGPPLTLTARRRTAGITWTLESAAAPDSWLPDPAAASIQPHPDGTESAAWQPAATAPRFFRLRAALP